MFEFPDLYTLFCLPSGTIEYSSTSKNAVLGFYRSLPDDVRELFGIVVYRADSITDKEEVGR